MSTQSAPLWPSDSAPSMVDTVSWLDVTSRPLANTPVTSVRYATSSPTQQLVFADRVLVFGGDVGLTTTVVWLNKGTTP